MNRSRVSRRRSHVALALSAALVLSACAETEFLVHTAKQVRGDSVSPGTGRYKIGDPYQIKGVWYYPAEDYQYSETGIASWYGPNFHGKKTANGETYNQNDLTAAHRTLPMPSAVRVTNLENGRSLVVRINDRGPFARGRIIDMSRRGAQLLGF
ncbi:MAG: septal ring lytic transglycosylase RlpA family protein, partial [Alphaproteobacteria bacterium]|nr:septal ring lytic transglycosylase RlpA family protein [Alphaproteobacteria bacterium]